MKKSAKRLRIPLTEADRLILNSYCMLSDCLSTYLGNAYEIVVHSFGEGDYFILKIINGGFSGRSSQPEIPDSVIPIVEQLELRARHGDVPLTVSFNMGPDGRKYKSASVAIRGSNDRMIGLLCLNYCLDMPFYDVIRSFALPAYLDIVPPTMPLPGNNQYDTVVTQTIIKMRDMVMHDEEIPAKFKRKEIIRRLNDAGVFKMKNSIQLCADLLGITIATIYMHIRNLDNE